MGSCFAGSRKTPSHLNSPTGLLDLLPGRAHDGFSDEPPESLPDSHWTDVVLPFAEWDQSVRHEGGQGVLWKRSGSYAPCQSSGRLTETIRLKTFAPTQLAKEVRAQP